MKISIAICTWNRSRLLKQTIDSLAAMTVPENIDWEIVVVDNRSTDDTHQVVRSFEGSLPIRYVFESEQGHSASRNTAIENAGSDYIVWTDNDVIVGRGWLAAYTAGFRQHPQAAYFGGRITPVFEADKPDWLDETWEKCKAAYAARDLGPTEIELGPGVFPYGANFAVRTEIQRQFRFNTTQGRKGKGMLGDDEIGVLRRINEAGHTGVWLPEASLEHFIPNDRATPDYIRRYFAGQGQTNIMQGKIQKTAAKALVEFVKNQIAWRWKRHRRKPDEWVSHLIRAGLSWGEYQAIRQQGRLRQ